MLINSSSHIGSDNCEMIPDGQGPKKLKCVYCLACKIITVFSIYASFQAGHYHVENVAHFTAAV